MSVRDRSRASLNDAYRRMRRDFAELGVQPDAMGIHTMLGEQGARSSWIMQAWCTVALDVEIEGDASGVST